jgi:hypothetical protein
MTFRIAYLVAGLLVLLACSSIDGVGGAGGTGGVGGRRQIASDQAKTPEECGWLGGGGSDLVPCDYLTVEFSTPLATAGLGIEATTNTGDVLTPSSPDVVPPDPALILSLDASETQVAGFTITRIIGQPHYSPAEISVIVTVDEAVVADATLEASYTCVELTSDDWCWQAAPLTLDVSP